ncbi:DoxX family protein [Sporomusa sp. KB1]|jgi:putative oxidoreductase|uniref:DoxX family protein n=1 Tax=Sporomusa sp. KB1 TaxID=943346 RepID=UPI00119CA21A|nr:DoxX family protein [Sporomusa sp. KB1]TWH47731.1 putative oxidoreductase [Sporomusa sp. KB1]
MKSLYVVFNQLIKPYQDIGLLLFRLGIGGMFMWHGFPKIFGGIEKWTALGKTMGTFGIDFAPAFWGFMSGFTEFFGGLLIVLGLFYRLAALLLVVNLGVAFTSQMVDGKGLMKASQSLEDGFSFLAALFVGPGKYSLDEYLQRK